MYPVRAVETVTVRDSEGVRPETVSCPEPSTVPLVVDQVKFAS